MDPDRARDLLAAERRRLESAIAALRHQDDGEQSDPFFDAANDASELYIDELDEGLTEDFESQLAAVARAERRLADGTYGLSIESGQPIPDARLEARPTAELTIEEERARAGG
jgi:DnaK suppressor protein